MATRWRVPCERLSSGRFAEFAQMKSGNQLLRAGLNLRVGHLKQLADEAEKFPRGKLVVEKRKIGHVGEAAARFERLRLHVKTADARGAGSRLHQSGEIFSVVVLPAALGPSIGEKFAARNGQRHVVDRDEFAEFFDEMDEFDH